MPYSQAVEQANQVFQDPDHIPGGTPYAIASVGQGVARRADCVKVWENPCFQLST